MYEVMKKIPTALGRLKYVSEVLDATARNLDELSFEDAKSVTEPFIDMLIGCSESVVVSGGSSDGLVGLPVTELTPERIAEDVKHSKGVDKIIKALEQGKKVDAVKLFRDVFGTTLKNSLEEVESVYDGNKIVVDKWVYGGKVIWRRKK